MKVRPYLSLILIASMFACEANDEPALSQAIADQAIAESTNTLVNPDSEAKAMDSSSYSLTMDLSCLLYTSPSPRDLSTSRMPSSA